MNHFAALFLFLIIILFFLLYNIVLVLPYINMHPPQVFGTYKDCNLDTKLLLLFPALLLFSH